MTKEQALQILANAAAKALLPLAAHMQIEQALKVIQKEVVQKDAPGGEHESK